MLLRMAGRERTLLSAGIGMGLLGAVTTLLQPLAVGLLIAAVVDGSPVTTPILIIAGLFLVDAALGALHGYLIGRAGENLVLTMRRRIFRRLLGSDLKAFHRLDHGDIQTRTVGDTSIASVVIAQAIASIVTSGFLVVGCLAIMTIMDWRLTAATVGCLGVASLVSILLARRVRRASLENREHTSQLGSGLHRVLGGLTTVKASRAEDRELAGLTEHAQAARRSGIRVAALSSFLQPAMNVGTQLSLAVVIAWGMVRLATGDLSAGELTAFVMYLFYLVSPLVMLFMSFGQLQQGMASVDRVAELSELEQEPAAEQPEHPAVPEETAQQTIRPDTVVQFDRVGFGYREDEPVLHDISFDVPRTGLTAVVGPSGAGKSSLLHLIEGFYRPDAGEIRVNGSEVGTMPLDHLRTVVGYVEQDSPLLKGTIRENLVYARPDATDEEIGRALRQANLTEVIAALPDGLDTALGERGAGLSGGQRQRLAIARTLLQQPQVLLLDEATAHLDGDSEASLRQTITEVAGERAVMVVAHRMSTVRHADQVLVMEDGRIRAHGRHEDLVREDELYARLQSHQELGVAQDAERERAVVGSGV